jgi:Putative rhamnosyl transferase
VGNLTVRRNFTHLLLTRFNTAMGYAPSSKRLEADWLTHRLALFEQYCLPSVSGQQDVDFHWLVFFDAATPAWFRAKISASAPLVRPIYVEGPASDEILRRFVIETGLVSSPYLITTRLDNDDAIAKDHLRLVQDAFCGQAREFITFPSGLQLFRDHLYQVNWPSNPFLSLIEAVEDEQSITTVFCIAHDHLHEASCVKQVRSSPQWLQVLHSENLGNELRGGWPMRSSRSDPGFNVRWPDTAKDDSYTRRLGFSAQAYGKRAVKVMRNTIATYRRQVTV